MRERSMLTGRAGMVAGAAVVAMVALPTVAGAAAGAAAVRQVETAGGFTCPPAVELNFATGGTYGSPKAGGAVVVKGSGTCTYTDTTGGTTYVIAHSPLGHSKFRTLAKAVLSKDHLTNISHLGKAAVHGTGSLDVLLVQQGTTLYEFLDKSGKSTLAQLEAMARATIPK